MTEIDVEFVEEIDAEEGNGGTDAVEAPEYVLYGGKGGVGKTTMAAATALASARAGTATLVVSTDPAHSLSDVLDRPVPDEPASIHAEHPLYGVEIDPDDADTTGIPGFDGVGGAAGLGGLGGIGGPAGLGGLGPFGGGAGSDTSDTGGPDSNDEDAGNASMPGADEAAALGLLLEYIDDERFERVVVDTAPTGHTLRLLELPDRLDATLDRMAAMRERLEGMFSGVADANEDADPSGFAGFSGATGFGGFGGVGAGSGGTGIGGTAGDDIGTDGPGGIFGVGGPDADSSGLDGLRVFRDRLDRLRAALSDPDRTDFRIVVVPERTSVAESRRLLDRLDAFDVPVGTVVVNRVMENVETVLGADAGTAVDTGDGDVGGAAGDGERIDGSGANDGEHGYVHDDGHGENIHEGNDGADADDAFVAPRPDACPFCRQRLRSQMDALGDADDLFRGRAVKRVPLLASEVRGEELLSVVAACLA